MIVPVLVLGSIFASEIISLTRLKREEREEYNRSRHIVDEADLYNYADYYDDVEEKLIRFADEYALAI